MQGVLKWVGLQINSLVPVPSEIVENPPHEVIADLNSHIWVNVKDSFKFLSNGSLIYTSEKEDGFCHLYLLKKGETLNLTEGKFQVLGSSIWVDEASEVVYFQANPNPLETHLFSLSYADGSASEMTQLTTSGFSHGIEFDVATGLYVTSFSNVRSITKVNVFSVKNPSSPICGINAPYYVFDDPFYVEPEIVSFEGNDGVQLYAAYMKPKNYREGVPHPTLIYLYGGPHVQLVKNHYALTMTPLMRLMCSFGYVVAVVDNRGSFNRGLEFEGLVKHKMGQVEVQDQVRLVEFLVKQGLTDPRRVAVTGWSYGGYLTLMCMSQRPDIFKVHSTS
jgi:dipeptidyl-peptidase 9